MALPVPPPDHFDPGQPLGRLASELRRAQVRYGVPATPSADGLENRLRAVRGRLRHLEEQIAELTAERTRLHQEAAGYEKGLTLVLGTELERLRLEHGEAWSPTPIRAYRVWSLHRGMLTGARMHWREPSLIADCARERGRLEVPHSDGRCGRPACGIYAAKHPDPLLQEMGAPASGAMGLVELSGKVVEHTRGYRAAQARVVALGLVGDRRWLTVDSPDAITAAFHDPDQTLLRWGRRYPTAVAAWAGITEYLIAREEPPWT